MIFKKNDYIYCNSEKNLAYKHILRCYLVPSNIAYFKSITDDTKISILNHPEGLAEIQGIKINKEENPEYWL